MRLTRNTTPDGKCKYAAVRNDKIDALSPAGREEAEEALDVLACLGVLEDPELARDVMELAGRSFNHSDRRQPD